MSNICAACSICQETFNDASHLSVLSCGHVFHAQCIDQWINSKMMCPLCRTGGGVAVRKVFWNEGNQRNQSGEAVSVIDDLYEALRLRGELQSVSKAAAKGAEKVRAMETALAANNLKLEAKDEQLAKAYIKVYSLRLIINLVNKSREKIHEKLKSIMSSDKVLEEMENVCSELILIKNDLELYKEKCDSLSKDLSQAEMKNSILEAKFESQKALENDYEYYSTSMKRNHIEPVSRIFTTPQLLLMSPPTTPASIEKRRMHKEIMSANPFKTNIDVKKKMKGRQSCATFPIYCGSKIHSTQICLHVKQLYYGLEEEGVRFVCPTCKFDEIYLNCDAFLKEHKEHLTQFEVKSKKSIINTVRLAAAIRKIILLFHQFFHLPQIRIVINV